ECGPVRGGALCHVLTLMCASCTGRNNGRKIIRDPYFSASRPLIYALLLCWEEVSSLLTCKLLEERERETKGQQQRK
ncbi:Hypothetical predicted protein, partial [Pelobates cultripes]